MSPLGRRGLLQSSLSVGSALLLAGCSAFGDGGPPERRPYDVPERSPTETRTTTDDPTPTAVRDPSKVVTFESVSIPDPGPAWYRRWLPGPIALEGPEEYSFDHFDLAELRAAGDAVPPGFDRHRRQGRLGMDYFGIGFENYEHVLRLPGGSAVIEADFEADAVAETLLATGYDEAGSHRRWRLFDRGPNGDDGEGSDGDGGEDDPTGAPRVAAVADGELVWGTRVWWTEFGASPAALVEAVVDARDGRGPRYDGVGVAETAAFGGGPPSGAFFPVRTDDGPFEIDGTAAWGVNVAFDEAPVTWVTITFGGSFDEETVVDSLKHWLAERAIGREATAVEVSTLGRTATIAMRHGEEWYSTPGEKTDVRYPQVTWGYDHDPEAGTLTVIHEAGDDLPGDGLDAFGPVVGDPFATAGTVTAGDETTIPLESGAEGAVEIRWTGAAVPIGRYVLPERTEGTTTGTTTTGTDA